MRRVERRHARRDHLRSCHDIASAGTTASATVDGPSQTQAICRYAVHNRPSAHFSTWASRASLGAARRSFPAVSAGRAPRWIRPVDKRAYRQASRNGLTHSRKNGSARRRVHTSTLPTRHSLAATVESMTTPSDGARQGTVPAQVMLRPEHGTGTNGGQPGHERDLSSAWRIRRWRRVDFTAQPAVASARHAPTAARMD